MSVSKSVGISVVAVFWVNGNDETHELTVKIPNTSFTASTPNTDIEVE